MATKKIKLLTAGYGGLPYLEGSVIETEEAEATFAVQSSKAIYADDKAAVTPVPVPTPAPEPPKTASKK